MMVANSKMLSVHFCPGSVKSDNPKEFEITSSTTVEQMVHMVVAELNIRPISVTLFGLRIKSNKLWLAPSQLLHELPTEDHSVQLRLRFRLPSFMDLQLLDEEAYRYLFYQVREDHLQEVLTFDKLDSMGLVVTDILHHMLAENVPLSRIEIGHFMPPSLNYYLKRFNVRRHVEKLHADALTATPAFIRQKYLEKASECMQALCQSPESDSRDLVGTEEFLAEKLEGDKTIAIRVMVAPFHPHHPGLRVSRSKKGGWSHLCGLEELVVISSRASDCTLELCQLSGVPLYFSMPSVQSLLSFVSCLSGYYRLFKCWTFDLCKEVTAPSIAVLKKNKCHGPVGAEFAHAKLRSKCGGEAGVGLLRQSSRHFDRYKLDVFVNKQANIRTYTITTQHELVNIKDAGVDQPFDSLLKLIRHLMDRKNTELSDDILNDEILHSNSATLSNSPTCSIKSLKSSSRDQESDVKVASSSSSKSIGSENAVNASSLSQSKPIQTNRLFLSRIIPPSEYDKPPLLLLCAGKFDDESESQDKGPRVFKFESFVSESSTLIQASFYRVLHARKASDENKHYAVKVPPISSLEQQIRFLSMCDDWCKVSECDALVQIMGITLRPLSVVMEWVPLGPLDAYLSHHEDQLKEVDLLEAVTHLAKALFFLSQEGIQHNNIRCHSLLVARHQDNQFLVKLSEPGGSVVDETCIHWIAREHHYHPPSSKQDPSTDVWAFATTAWQIFSNGQWPLKDGDIDAIRSLYAAGQVLPRPKRCPNDLYQIMLRCWSPDPSARRQPQTIMRDTFHLLYEVFNSRRQNAYSCISEDGLDDTADSSATRPSPDRQSAENIIYSPQEPDIDVLSAIGSVDTTVTTVGNSDMTLVHVDEEDDDVHADLRVVSRISDLPLADGSIAKVVMGVLPQLPLPFGRGATLPDSHLAPTPFLDPMPALSPIQPRTQAPVNHRPASSTKSLNEVLVPQSAQQDGQLFAGQILKMDRSNVKIEAHVGEGNYGWVYKGLLSTPGGGPNDGPVAVKTLKVVTGQLDDMCRERDIMQKLNHRNIVRLLGVINQSADAAGSVLDERMYMVMEYLEMGSLKTYLQQNPSIGDPTLLDFARDIAMGMDYLESQRIVHRDLAARNILVSSPNHVKISDFGLAQPLYASAYYVLRTKRDLPLLWYAPESIDKMRYSSKSDVWSYGVTCWEMFTRGKEPNLPRDPNKLLMALQQGIRLICLPPCPEIVYSQLIRVCWDHEPRLRPDFSSLVNVVNELKEEMMW